jgi:hypothetical protein
MKNVFKLLAILLALSSLAQVLASSKSEGNQIKFQEGNDKPGV